MKFRNEDVCEKYKKKEKSGATLRIKKMQTARRRPWKLGSGDTGDSRENSNEEQYRESAEHVTLAGRPGGDAGGGGPAEEPATAQRAERRVSRGPESTSGKRSRVRGAGSVGRRGKSHRNAENRPSSRDGKQACAPGRPDGGDPETPGHTPVG